MRLYYHVVVTSLECMVGGMEQSVARIVEFLEQFGDSKITLYLRNGASPSTFGKNIELVSIHEEEDFLLAALENEGRRDREKHRCQFLALKNEVRNRIAEFPEAHHLMVSFYITNSGFICQQVATELKIPHIACIRGSDINRDFRSPRYLSAILYVLNHASHVITTNKELERIIQPYLGSGTKVSTIYNSIPSQFRTYRWQPRRKKTIQLFTDCGFSSKKATHILISTVDELLKEELPIKLIIVGPEDENEREYWKSYWKTLNNDTRDAINAWGICSKDKIVSLLIDSDIYCTTSLGEGCSNGTITALALGVPIVASAVGVLNEVASDVSHISLVTPGRRKEFKSNLRAMINEMLNGSVVIDNSRVDSWRELFDADGERHQWEQIIQSIVPRRRLIKSETQKRVLFFVHDGTGLGHLKRLSRLGGAIQGPCACLMISGHWATPSIIPETMEFIHLPSFDSLLPNKSGYWGRPPFLKLDRQDAIEFRTRMLEKVVQEFNPDAIVIDYLPLGHRSELQSVINRSRALKYFIMRAVLDVPGNVRMDLLWGAPEAALIDKYKRLLVAGDRQICDVSIEYELKPELHAKLEYIGYVSAPFLEYERERIRTERRIPNGKKWVVCSAGGGALGEELIRECERLPGIFPDVIFDIVFGPRSNTKWPFLSGDCYECENVRYLRAPGNLDKLHGSADVVISTGGYNSMMEAIEGGAHLICSPAQRREGGEQQTHAHRLSDYYPIEVLDDQSQLCDTLKSVLSQKRINSCIKQKIDFSGISRFREILLTDLGLDLNTPKKRENTILPVENT